MATAKQPLSTPMSMPRGADDQQPRGSVSRRHAFGAFLFLVLILAATARLSSDDASTTTDSAGKTHTLLKQLHPSLAIAPWVAWSSPGETYRSYTKSVRTAAEGTPAAAAVIRVEVVVDAPPKAVYDAFVKPELTQQWNSFVGEVTQLSGGIQLQAYKFPWPFQTREYLVQCADQPLPGRGFRSHCASREDHPKAPRRPDRVRGMSETLWQFTPVPGEPGRTTLIFEGTVDPMGAVPKRIVNEIGKRTSVSTALALADVAKKAYRRSREGLRKSPSAPSPSPSPSPSPAASAPDRSWNGVAHFITGIYA